MKPKTPLPIALIIVFFASGSALFAQSFSVLHSFAGGGADGRDPVASLIRDGSSLYGMTPYGGVNDAGVLFSLQTDGSGYSVVHEFAWDCI